jgi:hypothetical protein
VASEGKKTEKWVRKLEGPMPNFDPQKEKDMYQRERKEVLGQD